MRWAEWFGGSLPERVVIVRALPGLGDLLCAVPALRALRAALPNANIQLIGLPVVRPLVARFSRYIDGLIEFPGFPGIPERTPAIAELPQFFLAMHQLKFDLAIQMHGNGVTSNPFTLLLGARLTAGFCLPSVYCPDREWFMPYPSHLPEVRRHISLMEFIGVAPRRDELEFPLNDCDYQTFNQIPAASKLSPGAYVCIHAGASKPERRWSAKEFATVADSIADRGLDVVLTGSAAELEVTQAVADRMHAPAINLAGKTELGSLAVTLSRSRLVICNDTGISHLAAALKVPSVVIYTTSDRKRWAPLDYDLHRGVGWPNHGEIEHREDDVKQRHAEPRAQDDANATPELVLKEAESLMERVSHAA